MPEAWRGDEDRADRSALCIILHSEFHRIAHEGNAGGSESIFGSGKAAEQHAVLGPELNALDACIGLHLQGCFGPCPVQQPDAPLIHKYLNRIQCATGRTADTGLHAIEEALSILSKVLFWFHTSSFRSSDPILSCYGCIWSVTRGFSMADAPPNPKSQAI
jgi:hypothetical protein